MHSYPCQPKNSALDNNCNVLPAGYANWLCRLQAALASCSSSSLASAKDEHMCDYPAKETKLEPKLQGLRNCTVSSSWQPRPGCESISHGSRHRGAACPNCLATVDCPLMTCWQVSQCGMLLIKLLLCMCLCRIALGDVHDAACNHVSSADTVFV